jgi:hypothetical protein
MRAVVAGITVLAAVLGGLIGAHHPNVRARRSVLPAHSTLAPLPSTLPGAPPADPGQLAAELNRAQALIDSSASPSAELSAAGWFEQLATLTLEHERTATRDATLARLDRQAAATLHANLAASAALAVLVTPRKSLPPWKIVPPPPPATLLGYFRAAQARFGVAWEYLAAIEFIETKVGRVVGLSTAGAEGPMQFLPSTWARYGRGDVHNPRDAIFGAARFLVAAGARDDIAGALYHYNPSPDYVTAVTDYASRMRADPRAYDGYYYWQVVFAKTGSLVILPVGFPRVRPVPLRIVGSTR